MAAIVFGLATGLAYGSHDFFGGMASRRASPLAVVPLFMLVALFTFAVAVPITGAAPSIAYLGWGAAAGVAVGIGNVAYFRALAIGRMGVVATVTAIWSAVVPLVAGVALNERPDPLVWAGIAAIVVSIALITYSPEDSQPGPPGTLAIDPETMSHSGGSVVESDQSSQSAALIGFRDASIAGIGFGLFFVAIAQASDTPRAMAWPLLVAAVVATLLVATVAAFRGVKWRPAMSQWPAILVAGVLYATANWTFILGVTNGWVSIVAVLAALSPVPTIFLARLILSESLSSRQIWGISLALVGVALITLGAPE